jgi:catechol 2,3-dioxygenase-like lactoylglutathione lyase family enzyme
VLLSVGAPTAGVAETLPPARPRPLRPPAGHDGGVIDHLSIQCADVAASAAFYDAVLGPLGGTRVMDFGAVIGFGIAPKPEFWIGPQVTGVGFREAHVAFGAPDRDAVRAFFAAAVARGAEVLHEPRVWPEYHPNYFGAFVRDPDGNNVEAVCHTPG